MSVADITKILSQALAPEKLEIKDDSNNHKGHAGFREGVSTHFDILIVSDAFENQTKIQRHKLIYKLLEKELKEYIHALSIKALTAAEYRNRLPAKIASDSLTLGATETQNRSVFYITPVSH